MPQKLGETKALILESCITPKSWSALVNIIQKSEPTLGTHLNDLQKQELIIKQNGNYQTTEKGISELRTTDFRSVRKDGTKSIDPFNLFLFGTDKNLGWEKEFLKNISELIIEDPVKSDSTVFHDVIADTLKASVTFWMPQEVRVDPDLFLKMNDVVADIIRKDRVFAKKWKTRIIIDIDLPKAFEMRILDEKDAKVKNKLQENRNKILDNIVKKWDQLFVVECK